MADKTKSRRNGAPVWLVTFADLMALLFALFVLILSFSEVDSDSFKKNAGPIAAAFNQGMPSFVPPIKKTPQTLRQVPEETDVKPEISSANDTYLREVTRNKLVNLVKTTISNELAANLLDLEVQENRIIMRFPAHSAFRAGGARLVPGIINTMDRIADILARTEGNILITGHTDNAPISTAQFPSNWSLSTARAVSVVHRLLRHPGLNPQRITATGHADTRPLAANDTPENRTRNRRVEISVEIPTSITVR